MIRSHASFGSLPRGIMTCGPCRTGSLAASRHALHACVFCMRVSYTSRAHLSSLQFDYPIGPFCSARSGAFSLGFCCFSVFFPPWIRRPCISLGLAACSGRIWRVRSQRWCCGIRCSFFPLRSCSSLPPLPVLVIHTLHFCRSFSFLSFFFAFSFPGVPASCAA